MNYLETWQIRFEKVSLQPFEGSFKAAIITNRLYKLILYKTYSEKWKVLHLKIDNRGYDPEFLPVLVSPTHGTILFINRREKE